MARAFGPFVAATFSAMKDRIGPSSTFMHIICISPLLHRCVSGPNRVLKNCRRPNACGSCRGAARKFAAYGIRAGRPSLRRAHTVSGLGLRLLLVLKYVFVQASFVQMLFIESAVVRGHFGSSYSLTRDCDYFPHPWPLLVKYFK